VEHAVWRNHKLQLNLLLLVIGIGIASVTTMRVAHAENDIVVRQQNFSGAHNAIAVGKGNEIQSDIKARSFAERNENAAKAAMKKPKTKRVILLIVVIFLIVFTYFNFMAIGDNSRYCTSCGYTGTMKAKSLCYNPTLNRFFKVLIEVLPVFLYAFSTKGRFICPQCLRSSTNKSIKMCIEDVQR
jgi:hypothetical protein